MRFLLLALLAAPLIVSVSHAQEATRMPPRSDDTPAAVAPKPKPYFTSPATMLKHCKVPEFLKCMKWTEAECVAVVNSSVAVGNAKLEAEAATKSDTEKNSDLVNGHAEVLIATMQDETKGKLLGCLSPPKH